MLARQSETTKRPLCEILFSLYKILKNISASLYFCSFDFAEFEMFFNMLASSGVRTMRRKIVW